MSQLKIEIPEIDPVLPKKVEDENAKNFEAWMNYLSKLHPRVKVVTFTDEEFNTEEYFKKVTRYMDKQVVFSGLTGVLEIPKDRIAAIVYFDHSTDSNDSDYSVEHSIVLCFGKTAWVCECGASNINAHHPKNNAKVQLYRYVPTMHQWGYVAREFIRHLSWFLKENSIPALPRKKPELDE